ncbi:P-loop containing nucleoside triphosphate hydrolase protein [Phlyctochytrium arcticum]|nr:P-loop containing nucleoside triphosphate hydrolase protein [Phlyctochytrium arcticum]
MAKKKGAKVAKQPVENTTPPDSDSEVEITFGGPAEQVPEEDNVNVDEEGNDLGGLMATLMANKGKKGKKGKKNRNDDEEDAAAILARLDLEEAGEQGESPTLEKAPAAGTKKQKKGAKKDADVTPSEPQDDTERAPTPKGTESPDTGDSRIKSKKEKEKERKERQKLAKKQQSKGSAKETSSPAEDREIETEADKKKKKGGGKVPSAMVAALQKQLAAQKAAEEELKRQQEEEERAAEEEQKQFEEEEKRKQEAKDRKKEKERLKKEELKKQGKYLTPAQKAAQAQQKARLDAMIAAGMTVEALNEADADADKKPKKVVYSSKKKKGNAKQQAASPADEVPPTPTEQPVEEPAVEAPVKDAITIAAEEEAARLLAIVRGTSQESLDNDRENESDGDVKDAWDMESEEEDVKESWDQDSDEESKKVSKPKKEDKTVAATSSKKSGAQAKSNTKASKPDQVQKAKSAAKPPASKNAKSKKVEESESEESEESSDEDSSDEETDSDDSDDDSGDDLTATEKQAQKKKEEAAARRQARHEEALANRSSDDLRSPICCILGHVDTGKTKLLDKIRQTNVQEGEAGGITQQIGATYFPMSAIKEKTALLHKEKDPGYKLPGLLVIDTPGHESFTNLRSRGSSLCNIAILVVDIVHGLEPQTLESLGLLRQRKTPFIVALNKIDRMYGWKEMPNHPTRETLASQPAHAVKEFNERVKKVIVEFAEQGLNACLYWDNPNYAKNVSLVPTSAITGEGIPDLLHLLVDLTQTRMTERLMYLSELECTVLEVKVIEGHGTTIDVVLSNGVLNEGDRIVVCGLNGPIVTTIRALLTPQPMKELRIKSQYIHNKTVKASLGVKVSAPDLEKAIAGSRLLVLGPDDDEDDLKEQVMGDLTSLLSSIDKSGKGVCVQASTLGSLEALLTFLKSSNIPVSGINIGPVHKKDVIRASVMLERAPEFAQLLAFDVPIDKDAVALAEESGVKIFTAEIIYHLFDQYTAYMKNLEEKRRADAAPKAVFPCALKIVPGAIFNKRNPIVLGVDVVDGNLKIGTPVCVLNEDTKAVVPLGRVTSIELNHKVQQEAKKGGPSVAIKIECAEYETPKLFGRHFDESTEIFSHITRGSIDILKTTFRNDLSMQDWALVKRLKKLMKIE